MCIHYGAHIFAFPRPHHQRLRTVPPCLRLVLLLGRLAQRLVVTTTYDDRIRTPRYLRESADMWCPSVLTVTDPIAHRGFDAGAPRGRPRSLEIRAWKAKLIIRGVFPNDCTRVVCSSMEALPEPQTSRGPTMHESMSSGGEVNSSLSYPPHLSLFKQNDTTYVVRRIILISGGARCAPQLRP